MARNASGRLDKHTDDMDELAGDTIPCSPPAFSRGMGDATQPTQVLGRPSLMLEPSSPASIIEVPASSPFQPTKQSSTRIGSRLAPAGTTFRPPVRVQQQQQQPKPKPKHADVNKKRPAAEPISFLSDDEDQTPPRGDIKPTTFKAQMATFAYRPQPADKTVKVKLRQIFDVFGSRFPSEKVRETLSACGYDVENTIRLLEQSEKAPARRLVAKGQLRGATMKPNPTPTPALTPTLTPTPTPTPTPASPPAQLPRRRLVQGLRRRRSPSIEIIDVEAAPSSQDPLVIDLVDDGREEDYAAEPSPAPSDEEDGDDKVLNCINSSSLKELAAMTGMKEALLEPLMHKRPFDTLAQARKVSADKKPGARKSARICIGETAVEAIQVFLDAVEAIDQVVAKCEVKGKAIQGVVESWDVDMFGQSKSAASPHSGSGSGSGDEGDLPPTPTSLHGGKYTRPAVPRQPELMDGHCVMKPFQLFGLNWMSVLYKLDTGCILADEMGLGKTCQVISLMCHLVEEEEREPNKRRRPWPNLIVVPPSTYNNWLAEFKKFAPELSVVGYRGTQAQRAEVAYMVEEEPEAYHVVLATYSQINSEEDVEAMRSFGLNAAIFDEGHKMKNPETKIYKDLKRIPAAWKMLLTGTPVQNNLLEMTSLLSFINPRLFEGCMQHIEYIFSQKVTIRDVSNGAFLYGERVRRARTILEPFILQRRKDQVLSDMPRKVCTVVRCEMSARQRATYEEYEAQFRMEASQRGGRRKGGQKGGQQGASKGTTTKGRANDQNNVWMQLRKAALHPMLFRRRFTDGTVEEMARILMERIPQSELHQPDLGHLTQELKNSSDFELHLWCRDYPRLLGRFDVGRGGSGGDEAKARLTALQDSGKVGKLLELVRGYQAQGDRVLVFSKFSRMIELLTEVLALEGVECRVLMGNTEVGERQQLIDEFNEEAEIPVFLLTTGAGGTGINLTSANKVVIFDQSDNPQDDIQAENRAHRLGQRRDVEVVRLISAGTVEELIYTACRKKIELANRVTGVEGGEGGDLEKEVRRMMEET